MLGSGQHLTIRLYNLANVPEKTLHPALSMAGRLLEQTGIVTNWQPGCADSSEGRMTDVSSSWSRPAPDSRGYVVARFENASLPTVYAGMTGYALPFAREGIHATVFYDRVEKLWTRSTSMPTISTILGAVLAHEIGHVLLGSREHAGQGIMKSHWEDPEFRLLACGLFGFSRENAVRMLAGAIRRERRTGKGQKDDAACMPSDCPFQPFERVRTRSARMRDFEFRPAVWDSSENGDTGGWGALR